VHHLLPEKTQAVIFEHKADLLAHTVNGSVHASLMSGLPEDETGLVRFSSTLVSPRTMFTKAPWQEAAASLVLEIQSVSEKLPEETAKNSWDPHDTLRLAIDAAIVRALHEGKDAEAARLNQPFEFVAVHTCRTSDEKYDEYFPFPDPVPGDRLDTAIKRGWLNVASLGPYDWGGNDGNYKVAACGLLAGSLHCD
jgi:hypothetical protein